MKVAGANDTGNLGLLGFMFGPSGVGLDALHRAQRWLGLEGTGRFAESVTESAPRTLIDMGLYGTDAAPPPGAKDNVLAKRAFSRAERGLPPEGMGSAEPTNPLNAWAAGEQGPAGAFMEAMFPNIHEAIVGAAAGEMPGVSDAIAAASDIAPGPAEIKAAFKTLGPLKNAVFPAVKGAAGALAANSAAIAGNPVVAALGAGAQAAAPAAAAGFGATRYVLPELVNVAEEQARKRAARPYSPLISEDGITDFDPLNPDWVHPRFRTQRGSASLLDDGADPEQKYLGAVVGIPGTVRGRTMPISGRQRNMYPGVYGDAGAIIDDLQVAPESPNLSRLFGTTRRELGETALSRPGNLPDTWKPEGMPANPRGSAHAEALTTPRNERRIGNLLEASRSRPDFFHGMAGWYEMDPLYQRMEQLMGPEEAKRRFLQQQSLLGLASPGSDVMTEINRGSRADYLTEMGRFDDFQRYGGNPQASPLALMPEFTGMRGHAFHSTAQAKPMRSFLESGMQRLGGQAKVPAYVVAGRVPELGYQTHFAVPDAHWARGVGLSDVRPAVKGAGKSASRPEMATLAPWYRGVAAQHGLEAVPAQALQWGALSRQTGVDTPVGAPKLELIADAIAQSAAARGVRPEEARDLFLRGAFPIHEAIAR